jgi:hypothetical protein
MYDTNTSNNVSVGPKKYTELLGFWYINYVSLYITLFPSWRKAMLWQDKNKRYRVSDAKFTGSSPDEVDVFNLPNPSRCTMALGPTQPLTDMITKNLPGEQRMAGA